VLLGSTVRARVLEELAVPQDGVLVGEPSVELAHVNDEIGEDRDVRDRLDRDLAAEVTHRGDAGEHLAAVDKQPARAA
jgi:hypothetical protein